MVQIDKKIKIAIVCKYPFPEGMAATNRIIAYSKGIIKSGGSVDVILMNATDIVKESKYPRYGSFEGINYYYPIGRYRFKNKLLHGFQLVAGILLSGFFLYSRASKERYSTLLISSDNNFILLYYSILGKLSGLKTVFIFDEFPTPIRARLKEKIPFIKTLAYKVSLMGIDGYISMTQHLLDFYCKIRKRPSIVVSSIIDLDRFENVKSTKIMHRQICYMGNMQLSKDNVDNIVKAFALIADSDIGLELVLYGDPSREDKIILERLVKDLNLTERVHFRRALYNDVPNILSQAYILVSSQPNTKRAMGGFPTKLGEYLCAGVPTLLTEVGEISNYITHMKHVFLVKPDDAQAYALMMQYIIDNYQQALQIAHEGKKQALEIGSNKSAGHKIIKFVSSL